MLTMPLIFEEGRNGECAYDVFSWLLKERIIFLNDEIHHISAAAIAGQLLFAQKKAFNDVTMLINSPGGSVSDMFVITDMMRGVKPIVRTVIMGEACSAGGMIALGGAKGNRFIMRNATLMLHDISSGAIGDSTSMRIGIEQTLRLRERLINYVHTCLDGTYTRSQIEETFFDRDRYLSAEEAKSLGLVDHIIDEIDLDNWK